MSSSIPCIQQLRRDVHLNSVDWSPDGALLAVGYQEGGLEVVTPAGRLLWQRDMPAWSTVRWSPDGSTLASGHFGGVALWKRETGSRLWLVEIEGKGNALSWSPDGQAFVSSGENTYVFDAASGQLRHQLDWPSNAVAWEPSGERIAAESHDRLQVFDARSGEMLEESSLRLADLGGLAWSPQGTFLAGVLEEGRLAVWGAEGSGERMEGPVRRPHDLRWSRDGRHLAAGSGDGVVRVWSLQSRLGTLIEGHEGFVQSVAFSPDGTRLASVSEDETLRIWDISVLTGSKRRERFRPAIWAYAKRQAATVGRRPVERAVDLWVPDTREYGEGWSVYNPVVMCLDGKSMIEGKGRLMRRVDLEGGVVQWETDESYSVVSNDLALSRDGRRVVSSEMSEPLRVWDVESGRLVGESEFREDAMCSSFSPQGDRVASALRSDGVRVWDAQSGAALLSLAGINEFVDWHPTEDLLLYENESHELCVCSPTSGEELARLEDRFGGVEVAAWSPDGSTFCTASRGVFRLFNREGFGLAQEWDTGSQSKIQCLSWSPSGRFVASGAVDSDIRIRDVVTGREAERFELEELYAWRLSWAPSEAFLVGSLYRDTTRIFDTRHLVEHPGGSAAGSRSTAGLPAALAPLPGTLMSLSRLGLSAPLSLLEALREIWSGGARADSALAPLFQHPGVARLAALRWPSSSRPGLLSLLLAELGLAPSWQPPPGCSPTELYGALRGALAGDEGATEPPPIPVAALLEAADALDERFFTLLEGVGPEAVAVDPGLPLRLLRQSRELPPVVSAERRLLGLRLRLEEGGRSQGSGQGSERTGVDSRGDLRTLLPSQLALPDAVLRAQHLRGGLLHRARSGREPPRLRPTVLVLDVSPPTFGPVESITRLAAQTVASTLLDSGVPVVLVLVGGKGSLQTIERSEDLVAIWTARSQEEGDAVRALSTARAMAETLSGGALEPIVLVLSQVYFGGDLPPARLEGVRGLFVTYPGRRTRPQGADSYERCLTLAPTEAGSLEARLGRLVA